jgi:alginate O-acetyltransferase complex protein AlgI
MQVMLFNSYIFIFVFLPVTLAVFFLIGARTHHRVAIAWLVAASLFYYGWWNPKYVALIVASILVNFGLGALIGSETRSQTHRKVVMIFGVSINLALLGYYKYANFFVDNLNASIGTNIGLPTIVLPLAISFFTFQQVAYLVDAYQGKTREYNFLHYCLFVTFFPQLIAGPIVHHKEMLPQFANERAYRFNSNFFAAGLTLFFLGLFKKVILADGVAVFSTPVFDAASIGTPLTIFEAWGGTLAYSFQLYFDFSAYSDMAVGLGLMFGVRLPLNFYSPYKATNIIDFWRRWHITLSRFLRDYLYIPLGGSRKGPGRRYVNLFLTMLLGGLWHGAGWTFVLWGAVHGIYLAINHAWHSVRRSLGHNVDVQGNGVGRILARTITFFAVALAWVLFRSEDMDAAATMYGAMFGFNGISLPETLLGRVGALQDELIALGFQFNGMFGNMVFQPGGVIWLLVLACITWLCPNLQDWIGSPGALREHSTWSRVNSRIAWSPDTRWAIVAGLATGIAVLGLSRVSEFLYFQF